MKLLTLVKTGVSMAALIATLAGCGGGGGGGSSVPTPETPTTLKVVVLNEAGSPVAAARVRVGSSDLNTDASGAASVTLPSSTTETIALVTKNGFATNAKTAVIYAGNATELRVTLFAHQVVSTFASNSGVTVTPGGAKIQIPATAGFRTSAGVAYTGNVTVGSSYFNPETLRGIQGFAGPYVGSDAGAQSSLISVGVIEAKFTAADGSVLEMTNVAPATLTFPATGNSGTLTSVPLWYYDEAQKMWVRDGQAVRQADGSYVGTVRHFTVWNADISVVNPATIKGCFRNAQGQAVAPVYARVEGIGWRASGFVDSNGNFEIRNAPSGIPLELQVLNPTASPMAITPLAAGEVRQLACVVLAGPATTFVIPPSGNFPGLTVTLPILTPTTPNVTPTTPTATPTTPTVTQTTPTVTPTTPTVSPTVPTVTPTTTTTASFAGLYSGNYSGNEIGSFNVVVSSAGVVSGTAISLTFGGLNSTVSGQVGSTGQVSLTATGTAGAAVFSGAINASGEVVGTWRYAGTAGGGTFSGRRI
jgi:hypothetical protein